MTIAPRRLTRVRAAAAAAVLLTAACAAVGPRPEPAAKEARKSGPAAAAFEPVGDIRAGETVRGTLQRGDSILEDDSSYVDVWRYTGRAGERLTVSMRSPDFDTYLSVAIGGQSLSIDDDGGGGTNSRVVAELPFDGTYHVVANSLKRGETGAYTVSLQVGPGDAPATPEEWARVFPAGGDPKERYAVVVGVDRYPRNLSANLEGPAADARSIRTLLIDKFGFLPQNVVMLLDGNANRERILAAAERHLGQAGPDGVAVFYYSGHGTRLEGNFGDQDDEGDGRDEALLVWGPAGGSVILDDELRAMSDRLGAGRGLFILDACNSGSGGDSGSKVLVRQGTGAGDGPASAASELIGAGSTDQRRRIVLTASRDDEVSWISREPWPNGQNESVFTHYLVQHLKRSRPSDTFNAVLSRVLMETSRYTKKEHGEAQTPQIEGAAHDETIHAFLARR